MTTDGCLRGWSGANSSTVSLFFMRFISDSSLKKVFLLKNCSSFFTMNMSGSSSGGRDNNSVDCGR